jgi:hypothetical protein
MDSVKPRRHAQISAVIHDESYRIFNQVSQFPRLIKNLSRIPRLVAVLQKTNPAGAEFTRRGEKSVGVREAVDIQNRVEPWKSHHANHLYICHPEHSEKPM